MGMRRALIVKLQPVAGPGGAALGAHPSRAGVCGCVLCGLLACTNSCTWQVSALILISSWFATHPTQRSQPAGRRTLHHYVMEGLQHVIQILTQARALWIGAAQRVCTRQRHNFLHAVYTLSAAGALQYACCFSEVPCCLAVPCCSHLPGTMPPTWSLKPCR